MNDAHPSPVSEPRNCGNPRPSIAACVTNSHWCSVCPFKDVISQFSPTTTTLASCLLDGLRPGEDTALIQAIQILKRLRDSGGWASQQSHAPSTGTPTVAVYNKVARLRTNDTALIKQYNAVADVALSPADAAQIIRSHSDRQITMVDNKDMALSLTGKSSAPATFINGRVNPNWSNRFNKILANVFHMSEAEVQSLLSDRTDKIDKLTVRLIYAMLEKDGAAFQHLLIERCWPLVDKSDPPARQKMIHGIATGDSGALTSLNTQKSKANKVFEKHGLPTRFCKPNGTGIEQFSKLPSFALIEIVNPDLAAA